MLVTGNRIKTYELLCAFDKMCDNEEFITNEIMIRVLFSPFYNSSIKYNPNFRAYYLVDFKNIPSKIKLENYYPVNTGYTKKHKFKSPKSKKILGFMYDYYLEGGGFKEVEDISLENIWLRQIHENNLLDLNLQISKSPIKGKMKKFTIPEIFIHNEFKYEIC